MIYQNQQELMESFEGILAFRGDDIVIRNGERLKEELIDRLAYNAAFNPNEKMKDFLRWVIRQTAYGMGMALSSINSLYQARGNGDYHSVTVPAINIRGLTYDTCRAIFRTARKADALAFLFEIARSEIGYTLQRPSEYSTLILAAGIREGFSGPVFVQGDHFQFKTAKYKENPEEETNAIKTLIDEAIAAGFYNIDIDASTLVDLDRPTITAQQEANFVLTAEMTKYIRDREPQGIQVSIGAEIGEVGGKNSTPEELRTFMDGYLDSLKKFGTNIAPISKISVQTGTSHGGVPLPDGTVAEVKLDLGTLETLSDIAIRDYKISGAVQHGASTLPENLFHRFPETQTAEVHLATQFQNMVYESTHFPSDLRDEIYNYLKTDHKDEWKEGQTEQQFLYKTRKKGFGPFKQKIWDLPQETRDAIGAELEKTFTYLFEQLNVKGSASLVREHVRPVTIKTPKPNID
jgi:fructose/tagatose bisphosphate aldolase